jgi:hypothetical protein
MLRNRRLKTRFLDASFHEGLAAVLEEHLQLEERKRCVEYWKSADPDARRHVRGVLAGRGLDEDAVMGATIVLRIDTVERFENLIAKAEARLHNLLREISRYREALSRQLRVIGETIQDVDFEDVTDELGRIPA